MGAEDISVVAIAVSIIVSILTVVATDFFGLRRDKAKLRMEFAWQLRQQRWLALSAALRSCPTIRIDTAHLLQSAADLIHWSITEVEPWLGSDRVQTLREHREKVEKWLNLALGELSRSPDNGVEVPSTEVNAFRAYANKELTDALQRMRGRYSPLVNEQNF